MTTIYAHINDGTDIRVTKVMKTLTSDSNRVIFFGLGEETDSDFRKCLIKPRYKSDRPNKVDIVRYVLGLYRHIIKNKPKTVICVNEYLGLFIIPLKLFFSFELKLDLYDSLTERYSISKGKYLPFKVFNLLFKLATNVIVTDDNRMRRIKKKFTVLEDKVTVIPNYPLTSNMNLVPSDECQKELIDKLSGINIFFAGSISKGRGVETLRDAISTIENANVYVAGWLYDQVANDFILNTERVHYIGKLTNPEYLFIASKMDFIYMFYDPINQNNLNASPNKVYDAILVGTPVLCNSEISIAPWIHEEKIGLISSYGDSEKLSSNIRSHKDCKLKTKALLGEFTWESLKDEVIKAYM
jgi:hypothetical protein